MKLKKRPLLPSFWKRTLAFLVDLLVVNLLLTPFESIVKNASFSFMEIQTSLKLILLMLSMSFVTILYFIMFEYKMQQSIGKMIFNLYVVSEEGNRIKLWQAIGRNLFIVPIFPFFLLWVIDPVYLIFKKRRLSEIVTKTVTVEAKNEQI